MRSCLEPTQKRRAKDIEEIDDIATNLGVSQERECDSRSDWTLDTLGCFTDWGPGSQACSLDQPKFFAHSKARAIDVLSKDLLCFHVYVSWVSETLGAKELLMETVLCFVLVIEGLLPPSSSLPAPSPPLTWPLRLPYLSEGSKGRSAASVLSLAWIIEKPSLPPLNLSPGLLVSPDHWACLSLGRILLLTLTF